MTETIRRLRLSDLSECKVRAKHERTRNDNMSTLLLKLAIALGRTMSDALDDCRPVGPLQVNSLMEQELDLREPRLEPSGSSMV